MRIRTEAQVPKCFRGVKCPYPQAQTAHGEYGVINYSMVGPLDGEVIVCMHGLNGSRVLFTDMGDYISKQGFRVLSFDFYGHGLSNAPKVDLCPVKGCRAMGETFCCGAPRGRYDLDFFVDQTDELLSLLGLGDTPVNLVGFSLGGTVAIAFAQRFPSRVSRLVAMSPAGLLPKVPPTYYLLKAVWCCLIPLAPHLICTCLYKRERFEKDFKRQEGKMDPEAVTSLWTRFVWSLYVKRGVASATLAVCHRVPWFNMTSTFKDAGRHQRPVLLVWGEKDSLNPTATVAQEAKTCFPNSQLLVVPGAGHIAICDRPRQVVFAILDFLRLPATTRMDDNPIKLVPPAQPKRPLQANNQAQGELAASGPSRQVASASQMPVPMVLGHMDAGSRDVAAPVAQL